MVNFTGTTKSPRLRKGSRGDSAAPIRTCRLDGTVLIGSVQKGLRLGGLVGGLLRQELGRVVGDVVQVLLAADVHHAGASA